MLGMLKRSQVGRYASEAICLDYIVVLSWRVSDTSKQNYNKYFDMVKGWVCKGCWKMSKTNHQN